MTLDNPSARLISPAEMITGLDVNGNAYPIEKLEAHRRNVRHLAISVFVFDGDHLLLQQRAEGKYHSGGLWANTCCSHPRWDETAQACATRRLQEELGFSVPLEEFACVEYSAPVGPLFENEVVHCFRGRAEEAIDLAAFDPTEVQAVAWRRLGEIAADLEACPDRYAPWLRIYMERHASPAEIFAISP
jgi:isopentenyl-diphosphate delta-isomerase